MRGGEDFQGGLGIEALGELSLPLAISEGAPQDEGRERLP